MQLRPTACARRTRMKCTRISVEDSVPTTDNNHYVEFKLSDCVYFIYTYFFTLNLGDIHTIAGTLKTHITRRSLLAAVALAARPAVDRSPGGYPLALIG